MDQEKEVETIEPVEKPVRVMRKSGIDLLRIFAILLIVFSHANQTMRGIVVFPNYSPLNFVSLGLTQFGNIGNILFVICSSYFLVDKTRTRTEKAINILIDSVLISVGILVGFLIAQQPLSKETIVWQILPDIFKMNWFVPCYVVFYLLAPIVVMGLRQLSKKAHFILSIVLMVVYGILSMLTLHPVGSMLFQFFYLLTLVAFIKWHIPSIYKYKKINLLIFGVGIIISFAGFFGFQMLYWHNPNWLNPNIAIIDFNSAYAPILVIALLCLFNVFAEMKFENGFISYLSSCSLFVYVIHENYLLRSYTRVEYYNFMVSHYGGDNLMMVWMVICALFMFVVGFILAVGYKESIHRLTGKLSSWLNNLLLKLFDSVYKKLFKE